MKNIQYNTIDKSAWPRGEWDNEPDKAQFIDEATGLPCLIVRVDWSGHLCGYVGVSEGHPTFEKDLSRWDDGLPSLEVHGGITFGDFCQETKSECRGVCHKVEEGENDRVWWHGFDCHHSGDWGPALEQRLGYGGYARYRNFDYVKGECQSLARQLKEIEAKDSMLAARSK